MCGGREESAERDRYLGGAFLRDGQASGIVNWDFVFSGEAVSKSLPS